MSTYDPARLHVAADTARARTPRRWVTAEAVRRICASVTARQDAFVRREIAERHEVLAHHREVGGEFSVLP